MTVEQQQIDAGQDILERREAEQEARVPFPAFSRVVLQDAAGEQHVFWLVERVYGDLQIQRTWSGTAVGGIVPATALDEGNVVSKNARLGLLLDEYGERLGEQVPLPHGLRKEWGVATATVTGCTHYIPRGGDAMNGSMYVGVDAPLNFLSLKVVVDELKELISEFDVAPELLEVEVGAIKEQMRERDLRIQAFREAKRIRIRHVITNAALRNQPKLDLEQLRVKQLQILDGQVIIHGGPGTGKTTALLDRITLLTDRTTIRDHVPGLSDAALDRLSDPATAYLLFTPNELLLHYLREAMNAKGLLADTRKLTTWQRYRDQLAHQMGLLTADAAKSRFVKDRRAFRTQSRTFDVKASQWSAFISVLCRVFSEFVSRRHARISKIEADASSDPELVREVQERVAEAGRARGLPELMRVFQSLYDRKNEAATEAHQAGLDSLKTLATRLHARILSDKRVHRQLLENLTVPQKDAGDGAHRVSGVDKRSVAAGQKPNSETATDEMERINSLARSLLRKLALRRGLAGIRFTKREQAVLDHVHDWIDRQAVEALAPTLLTGLVHFACTGPDRNVVDQVGPFYLWLRRTHFAGRLGPFLHSNLRERLAARG